MRPLAVLLPLLAAASTVPTPEPSWPSAPSSRAALASLRATQFVPNHGQWGESARFGVFGDAMGWLHDDGFSVRLERWSSPVADGAQGAAVRSAAGCVVRTRFVAAATPRFEAEGLLPTRRNFLVGADRSQWRTDVPAHARVTMRGVYDGVDVQFRPLPDGRAGVFEYDLLLQPGADLGAFAARCEGVDRLAIDAAGRLCATVRTDDGEQTLVQEAPIAWQETAAGPQPLRVSFRLLDARTFGFVAPDRDPALAAVVDPGVMWSTLLGGGLSDRVNGMRCRDGFGVWVGGWASSTDFPTTPGAYRVTGGYDAFVARCNDAGSALIYATYLGGSGPEEVRGLDLGPGDTPTVVGFTRSSNFPTSTGALRPSYGGSSPFLDLGDGFVARLSANGSALLAATYLGGVFDDVLEGVRVDAAGDAYVGGWSSSPDMPTSATAVQPAISGVAGAQTDGYFARVTANCQSLVYGTYCGGVFNDQIVALDRDPTTGHVVGVGWSLSPNYPTTSGVVRPTFLGLADAVVTRLNATGTAYSFSTYMGGLDLDFGHAARFAADGSVWIGGTTQSLNYPLTVNAPQTTFGGDRDGFVMRLSANGQSIAFSTFLGGPGSDRVRAIDCEGADVAVVGECGDGFPVTQDAAEPTFGGGTLDAFVCYLTANGGSLAYATYQGGGGQDMFAAVDLQASGRVVAAGRTFSSDFGVTPGAAQASLRGVEDGVVVKFDLLSTLGDALVVAGDAPGAPTVVGAGEQELFACTLGNGSVRDAQVEAVRVFVGGAGDALATLRDVRFEREVVGSSESPVIVANVPFWTVEGSEASVPLVDCVVPAGGAIRLRMHGRLVADAAGRSVEVAVAIVDRDAWTVRADGFGGGVPVGISGSGRVDGRALVVGRLAGDFDGDGAVTVGDLRRRVVGQDGPGALAADCDGDAALTPADLQAARGLVLGRATAFDVAPAAPRGAWRTIRCVGLAAPVVATLADLPAPVGTVTARECAVFVPADARVGAQTLRLVGADGAIVELQAYVQ